MEEINRASPATADELYRQAQDHMLKARELMRAARQSGLQVEPENASADLIDFDALPGLSPRARAEALYMGRRIRDARFPPGLFAEFAWDILLELFLARRDGGGLAPDEICKFAQSQRATIGRYVSWMTELGLVETSIDVAQPICERVRLTDKGRELVTGFFEVTDGQIPGETGSEHRVSSARTITTP